MSSHPSSERPCEVGKTWIDNRRIIRILFQAGEAHSPYECSQFVDGLEAISFSQPANIAGNGFERFGRRMEWQHLPDCVNPTTPRFCFHFLLTAFLADG